MLIWDKYDKGNIIGYGVYGNIYKCKNKSSKNYVAIQEIEKKKVNQMYMEEIKIMKKIENENSIILKEYFDTEDYFYIVMELCICNLEECIQMRENGFSINEIKEVLIQINNTLKLMKAQKIILKYLKPSNILISLNKIDKYLFKLSNFDIMSNIGNHLSMAPEILDKDKFGKEDLSKSDLWSIGIIIYYLYFKQYPYNGKDGTELCKDIYSNKQLNEINNEKLNDLMNKLLKINVKERISWNEYFNHFFFTNGEKDLNYLTLFKTLKKKLCHHKDIVYCLTLLNDGRLVSGSDDNSIIIYNEETFEPDLNIEEHKLWINYLTILKNGLLVSCSADKTIKLFDIKEKEYKLINSLDFHLDSVNQIIELTNNSLVSCSDDKSIIFYIKENEKYNKDYSITTSDWVKNIIQTKQNEIAYSTYNERKLYFFDLNKKKNKVLIEDIICSHKSLFKISEELLLVPGLNMIHIINLNTYLKVNSIYIKASGMIYGVCMLNSNMFITGNEFGKIDICKIDKDNNIKLVYEEQIHEKTIFVVLKLKNGHFATASEDNTIKIW